MRVNAARASGVIHGKRATAIPGRKVPSCRGAPATRGLDMPARVGRPPARAAGAGASEDATASVLA